MLRVHVICEGQTEEMFVNELLLQPLMVRNVCLLPSKIGRPGHKGGNIKYDRLLLDIKRRLWNDVNCYCTTLMDYYGLDSDFPGKAEAVLKNGLFEKYLAITKALEAQVLRDVGEAGCRFIPYIQMHEFEGLLFSQPDMLAKSLQQPELGGIFNRIRFEFDSPEEINDNYLTAPSKRIEAVFTTYDKPIHPVLAAKEIGLDTIRSECSLFNGWIRQLEQIRR
ncbi:MAG: DUF4276 family protein [Bacillota bacterium]